MARLPLCELDGAQESPSRRLRKQQSSEDEDPWVQSLLQAELASYAYEAPESPKPSVSFAPLASPALKRSQTVPNPQRLVPCAVRRPTFPPSSPERAVFVRQLLNAVVRATGQRRVQDRPRCPTVLDRRLRDVLVSRPSPQAARHRVTTRSFLGPSRRATSGSRGSRGDGRARSRSSRTRTITRDEPFGGDYSLLARAHPSRSQARGLRWLLSREE